MKDLTNHNERKLVQMLTRSYKIEEFRACIYSYRQFEDYLSLHILPYYHAGNSQIERLRQAWDNEKEHLETEIH